MPAIRYRRRAVAFTALKSLTRWNCPGNTNRAVSSLLLRVTRIVCRIHILDHKWTHAVDLDNCFRRRPSIVLHPGRDDQIAASAQLFPGCFIELISRADVKRAGNHRDMLSGWVRMWRNLVTSRHLQPHRE